MDMSNLEFFSIAETKAKLSSIVEKSKTKEVIITKNGKPEVVLINYEKFINFMSFIEEIKDLSLLEIEDIDSYKEIKKFFNIYDI